MNIYIDIDGVLVGTKSPKEDIIDLLQWIVSYYPHNTYWLTTHCQRESNRCSEYLKRQQFPKPIIEAVTQCFKPTEWDVLKTDAIDFAEEFVWLEDAPLQSELQVLKEKAALNCLLPMDKHNPQMAKLALKQLIITTEKTGQRATAI